MEWVGASVVILSSVWGLIGRFVARFDLCIWFVVFCSLVGEVFFFFLVGWLICWLAGWLVFGLFCWEVGQ